MYTNNTLIKNKWEGMAGRQRSIFRSRDNISKAGVVEKERGQGLIWVESEAFQRSREGGE